MQDWQKRWWREVAQYVVVLVAGIILVSVGVDLGFR